MRNYVADTVRRLLELHSLEERLGVFQRCDHKSADIQTQIESLRAGLPGGVVSGHDRFRAAGKRSVAEVRHGVCSACHMTVSFALLVELKRCDGLPRCQNCGRYFYLVEEEESDRQPKRPTLKRTNAARVG